MKQLRFHQRASAGRTVFGIAVTWPSAGMIECVGQAWDFVWIDAQHGTLDFSSILECVRACDLVGAAAFVRVPGHASEFIGPILDLAPAGIIVPMVNTEEQARTVVSHARFAPLGCRSYGGRRICDLHGRQYVSEANSGQLLIVQVETPEAVDNAEAIAAVPGGDWLLFGPDDTRVRLDLPMDSPLTEEPLASMARRTVQAAAQVGKGVIVPVGSNPALIRWALGLGFRGLVVGSDVGFARDGSAKARAIADEFA